MVVPSWGIVLTLWKLTRRRKGRDDILHGKGTYDRELAIKNEIVQARGDKQWVKLKVY